MQLKDAEAYLRRALNAATAVSSSGAQVAQARQGLLEVFRRTGSWPGQVEMLTGLQAAAASAGGADSASSEPLAATAAGNPRLVDLSVRLAVAHYGHAVALHGSSASATAPTADLKVQVVPTPPSALEQAAACLDAVLGGCTALATLSASGAATASVPNEKAHSVALRAARTAIDVEEARCVLGIPDANNFASASLLSSASATSLASGANSGATGDGATIAQRLGNRWQHLQRSYLCYLQLLLHGPASLTSHSSAGSGDLALQIAAAIQGGVVQASPAAVQVDACAVLQKLLLLLGDVCKLSWAGYETAGSFANDAQKRLADFVETIVTSFLPSGSSGLAEDLLNLSAPQRELLTFACELCICWAWQASERKSMERYIAILQHTSSAGASAVVDIASSVLAAAQASVPSASPGANAASIQSQQFSAVRATAEKAQNAFNALPAATKLSLPWASSAVATLHLAASRLAPNSDKRTECAKAAAAACERCLSAVGYDSGTLNTSGSASSLLAAAVSNAAGRGQKAEAWVLPGVLSTDVSMASIGISLPSTPVPAVLVPASDVLQLASKPPAGAVAPPPSSVSAAQMSAAVLAELADPARGGGLEAPSVPLPRGSQIALSSVNSSGASSAQLQFLLLLSLCQSAAGDDSAAASTAAHGARLASNATNVASAASTPLIIVLRTALQCMSALALASHLHESLLRGPCGPGVVTPLCLVAVDGDSDKLASEVTTAVAQAKASLASLPGGHLSTDCLRVQLLRAEALLKLRIGDVTAAIALASEAVSVFTGMRKGVNPASSISTDEAITALLPLHLSDSLISASTEQPLAPFSPVILACFADDGAYSATLTALATSYWYSPNVAHRGVAAAAASVVPATAQSALLAAAARDPANARAWAVLGSWFAVPEAATAYTVQGATISRSDSPQFPAANNTGRPRNQDRALQCLTKAVGINPQEDFAGPLLIDVLVAQSKAQWQQQGAAATSSTGGLGLARTVAESASLRNPSCVWAWWRLGALAYTAGMKMMKISAQHHAAAAGAQAANVQRGTSEPSGSADDHARLLRSHTDSARAHSDLAEQELTMAVKAYSKCLSFLPAHLSALPPPGQPAAALAASSETGAASSPVGAQPAAAAVASANPHTTACAISAWHGLAVTYRAQGRQTGALRAAEMAVSLSARYHNVLSTATTAHTDAMPEVTTVEGLPVHFQRAPASLLATLASCHSTLFNSELVIACLTAALSSRPRDPASWYSRACAHRSYARRCIGDGDLGRGLLAIRDGNAAVNACLKYGMTESTEAFALSSGASDGLNGPAAAHKLLGDLCTITYDAAPFIYGPVAAAIAVGASRQSVAMIDMSACAIVDSSAGTMIAAISGVFRGGLGVSSSTPSYTSGSFLSWVAKAVGLVSGAADGASALLSSSDAAAAPLLKEMGPKMAALTVQFANGPSTSVSHARATGADLAIQAGPAAVLAYARAVEAVLARFTAAGSASTPATVLPNPSSLSALLCDLGRALYLLHLSTVYAVGRGTTTGQFSAGRAAADATAGARPGSAMATILSYAHHLKRMAAHVHKIACAVDPTSARAWNGLGCTETGVMVAQHALIRSVELGGGGIALCNLGVLYVSAGRLDLASTVLLQAQTKDPNNEAMWLAHGMVHDALAAQESAPATGGSGAAVANATSASSIAQSLLKAAASYTLATDLSLHPAALLPLTMHMLGQGLESAVSTPGGSGPASSATLDALTAAQLCAEKDACNPLALVVHAAALAASAAEATAALDLCSGSTLALGLFAASVSIAAVGSGAGERSVAALLLAHARPSALEAAAAAVSARKICDRDASSAAAAGWHRVATTCRAAVHRLEYLDRLAGAPASSTSEPTYSAFHCLRLLERYAESVSALVAAPLPASSGGVAPLVAELRGAQAAGGAVAPDPLLSLLQHLSTLGDSYEENGAALHEFCEDHPSSIVAHALAAQVSLSTAEFAAESGSPDFDVTESSDYAMDVLYTATALFKKLQDTAKMRSRLTGSGKGISAGTTSAAATGGSNAAAAAAAEDDDVWGDGAGGDEEEPAYGAGQDASASPASESLAEARVLFTAAGAASMSRWLQSLHDRLALINATA